VSSPPSIVRSTKTWMLAGLTAMFVLIVFAAMFLIMSYESEKVTGRDLKIWVLPFENRTQVPSMSWVEFGLADMMASDLMLIDGVEIISPVKLSARLLTDQGETNSDIKLIQGLLEEFSIDVAIKAEVTLTNNQQSLRYQVVSTQDILLNGVIERPDLAVDMPNIVSQLFGELKPHTARPELPNYGYVPSAMHEYARGIHALNNEGVVLARFYFGASSQIDSAHYWSLAYLGACQLYLGRLDEARSILLYAAEENKDPSLQQYLKYWLALLEYRQGDFEKASFLLAQVHTLGVSTENNAVLTRWVDRLGVQIIAMQSSFHDIGTMEEQKELLFMEMADGLFGGGSFIDSRPMRKSVEKIRELKEEVRRLTIKGYKPALFARLLALAYTSELDEKERQFYLTQALEVIDDLQQPYEHALLLLLIARNAMSNVEGSSIEVQNVLVLLRKAKQIAGAMNAKYLVRKVTIILRWRRGRLSKG